MTLFTETRPVQTLGAASIHDSAHGCIEGLSKREAFAMAATLESGLGHLAITLLPQTNRVLEADLRKLFPQGRIVVCDLYVDGIEQGSTEHLWGYQKNGIENVDHHAPTAAMSRAISSGNLACLYVGASGVVPPEIPVVINHTDCDSIITALILRGFLPPHKVFERAVLAADHTGAQDPIASLLQALDRCQPAYCARQLIQLLREEPYDRTALELIERREKQRGVAAAAVADGRARHSDGVVLVRPGVKVESDLLLPLFPQSTLIISGTEMGKNEQGRTLWEIKLRLGMAAPAGLTINDLGARTFDPCFGGRWNAGSTNRSGGTTKTPEEYLAHYLEQLQRFNSRI